MLPGLHEEAAIGYTADPSRYGEFAMIRIGSQVKLHLVMAIDGKVVDNTAVDYVQGEGGLLGGLQEQLLGLQAGDTKQCTVLPEKAYGEHDPDRIVEVQRAHFGPDAGDLKEGHIVKGSFGGIPCEASVLGVGEETVQLDLNHPMAGKELQFAVKVVEVLPPEGETAH